MDAMQQAEAMLDKLVNSAEFSLASGNLPRQDRFGYEADQRLRPLHDHLVGLGWIVDNSTRGSVYYRKASERLRLSNHEVPLTAEREESGWTWAKNGWQVITERMSLDACMAEIEEIEEALAE